MKLREAVHVRERICTLLATRPALEVEKDMFGSSITPRSRTAAVLDSSLSLPSPHGGICTMMGSRSSRRCPSSKYVIVDLGEMAMPSMSLTLQRQYAMRCAAICIALPTWREMRIEPLSSAKNESDDFSCSCSCRSG